MSSDTLFVIIGNAPYHATIQTSKQRVTAHMARRFPTLYLEPPPATLDPILKPKERGRYFDYKKGIRHDGPGEPFVVCPPPFRQFMDTRWRFIDAFNQRRLGRFLKAVITRFEYKRVVLISFVYNAGTIAHIVSPDLFAYYCVDLWIAAGIPFANPHTIDIIERDTIAAADIVFAVSQPLVDRITMFHHHVIYSPHGVDYDLFSQPVSVDRIPADIIKIPSPRIGYVGTLAHWIDYDLITNLAQTRRDLQFVLIGGVDAGERTQQLRTEPNVHLLGVRPLKVVPSYLAAFDVCFVPHFLNDRNRYSNSLKVLQFLAAGKPVVSTAMPETERYAPPVRIADSPTEFLAAIDYFLTHWSASDAEQTKQFAAANNWDRRVDNIVTEIELEISHK